MKKMKPALRLLTKYSELEAIGDDWRELLSRSRMSGPMLAPPWLLTWWRVFGKSDGRKMRVLALYEQDRLVGLAPLLSRTHWYRPGLPFQRLELLGSGEAESDEICSEYIGIIAEEGREERVAEALSQALINNIAGDFNEIVMPVMASDNELPSLFAMKLEAQGLRVSLETTSLAPFISLPNGFDDYLASLPSSRRYLVSRSIRDLERWAGQELTLRKARDLEEFAYAKSWLERLHGERWSHGGVFASSRFRAFHDEIMPSLFQGNALDLLWIEARGEPIAALYNIVWQGKVYFYQSGRRLDLPNKLRPGIAMHALAIQHSINEGYSEYDFLGGASQYKMQLATSTRPLVELRAVRPSLRESTRQILRRARRQLVRAGEKAREQERWLLAQAPWLKRGAKDTEGRASKER